MSIGPVCSLLLRKLTNSEAGPTEKTGWKGPAPGWRPLETNPPSSRGVERAPLHGTARSQASFLRPAQSTYGRVAETGTRWSSVGPSSHTENSREGDHPRPSFTCSWCLEYLGHPRDDSRLGGTTFVYTACPRLMTPDHVLSSRISEQPETARVYHPQTNPWRSCQGKCARVKVLGGKEKG